MTRFLAIFLLFFPLQAMAQSGPEPISSFVNDFADIIHPENEGRISSTLRELKQETGVEMTVVTIRRTSDYGPAITVPSFTTALMNQWRVGSARHNNGIMLLVSMEDREMFIGLGSGYPAEFDQRMDRVFAQSMKLDFEQGHFGLGIENGVYETIKRTSLDWGDEHISPISKLLNKITGILFFTILGGIIVANFFWSHVLDYLVRYQTCPECGQRTLSRSRQENHSFGPLNDTEVVVMTRCSSCDHRDENRHVIPRSRDGGELGTGRGSRGSISFGGGRSSGGGGGGRW